LQSPERVAASAWLGLCRHRPQADTNRKERERERENIALTLMPVSVASSALLLLASKQKIDVERRFIGWLPVGYQEEVTIANEAAETPLSNHYSRENISHGRARFFFFFLK
jgi:hypothetical protein